MLFSCIRKLLFAGLALAVATGLSPALFAQDATARIIGTVTDPSGALVSGAAITVTNVDTSVSTPAKSEKNGDYTVNQLPIGTYKVTA